MDSSSSEASSQYETENGKDPQRQHTPGPSQLLHGPFSYCSCLGCMEDAKKEAEKRFDTNTFAFEYIKKLEHLVTRLQIKANGDDTLDPHDEIYYKGRMRRRSSVGSAEGTFDFSKFADPSNPSGNLEAPKEAVIDDDKNGHDHKEHKMEIRRMKTFWDEHGNPKIEKDRVLSNFQKLHNPSNRHILSVFREYDKKKNYWRRSLQIQCPPFVDLIRRIAYTNVTLPAADDMLCLKEPFMPLFHIRYQLANFLHSKTNNLDGVVTAQAKEYTILILDFLENESQDVMRVQDDLKVCDPLGVITYEHVWLLYTPGTIVFSRQDGEYEAFVVESVRGCQRHSPAYNSRFTHSDIEITCWSIDYDGEIFGRVWTNHCLTPFEGLKEISSLELVPEAFLPDRDAVKASLVERGQNFWGLQGQCFKEYTGEVWSSHTDEQPIRVMVDHLTYQRRMGWPIRIDQKRGPANAQSKNWRENRFARRRRSAPRVVSCSPERPGRVNHWHNRNVYAYGDRERDMINVDHYSNQDQYESACSRYDCDRPPQASNALFKTYDVLKPDTKPDEMTRLLCPQIVHGYCLRDKVWKKLNVTQLRPVNFRKNAWERLVLDTEYKDIVQAMVSSYVDKAASIDDLIAGKGVGLVTLLHGPPGTGKTLTAECVAEAFGKPLYQVTCGEIGTRPDHLEGRLDEIFDDAVTWGAILVLDEADVFLQERDYENLERNALVSIFLRTLEYFNGILFLTTNRVGTFDQAFQSRIHITLGLPILDQPRRNQVWTIFLQELAKAQRLTPAQLRELQSQATVAWSRESLNGRQIRNSVRTALLVAEKKKEIVSRKHFETVLRIGKEFENYMNVLRKGEADVVAEVKGDRLADLGGFQEVERL
ncbi:MAG: hypothetical protein Q9216_001943 [Gyalolechia sp. 2 TL-2023]